VICEVGEVGRDDALVRWQGTGATREAPDLEMLPVERVGATCGSGLLGFCEAHCEVDVRRGEGAGQDGIERDQVVQRGLRGRGRGKCSYPRQGV
jgi:hypothetical protein